MTILFILTEMLAKIEINLNFPCKTCRIKHPKIGRSS